MKQSMGPSGLPTGRFKVQQAVGLKSPEVGSGKCKAGIAGEDGGLQRVEDVGSDKEL